MPVFPGCQLLVFLPHNRVSYSARLYGNSGASLYLHGDQPLLRLILACDRGPIRTGQYIIVVFLKIKQALNVILTDYNSFQLPSCIFAYTNSATRSYFKELSESRSSYFRFGSTTKPLSLEKR